MSSLRRIDRPCSAGVLCPKHALDQCPFNHSVVDGSLLPPSPPPSSRPWSSPRSHLSSRHPSPPPPPLLTLPPPPHLALFGDLSAATHFPVPESTALEFKESFGSCPPEKTIQTVCAILNAGGGTLIVGVHDGDLEIVGVNPHTKSFDSYLLTLDTILQPHVRAIRDREDPGRVLSAATVTTSHVTCALGKVILFVHVRDVTGAAGRYMTHGGETWSRLNASIRLEDLTPRTVFSQQDMDSARQSERDRAARTSLLALKLEARRVQETQQTLDAMLLEIASLRDKNQSLQLTLDAAVIDRDCAVARTVSAEKPWWVCC